MRPDHGGSRPRRVAAAMVGVLLVTALGACTDAKEPQTYEAFCKQVKKVPPLRQTIAGYTDTDRKELQAKLEAARDAYQKLAEAAPDEIKREAGDVVKLVKVVIDAVATHPDDQLGVASEVQNAVTRQPSIQKSSERLVAAADRECKVDLNPQDDPTTSTTGGEDSTSTTVDPAATTTTTG